MSRKINFTKIVLENIKLPETGQRLVLIDNKMPGLQCRVTATGVKTFSVYRRVKSGLPERITLGKYPDMSIEQARREAAQINASIACGGSPAKVKRANKEETNFKELFTEYMERHSKIKKRTWKKDEAHFKMYLEKPLGKKKISEITRVHIAILHGDITKQLIKKLKNPHEQSFKSGSTANRVMALISSVFGWGFTVGMCENNPARGIKKNPEYSRDRFLQSDELPKFFAALASEENIVLRDYLMLLLLTGARRNNVISMKWDEISFERKEWRIPRTKNNEPQTVPLTDEVIHILNERKGCDYFHVFPGTGKSGHMHDPRRGWLRVLERAGIKDLRIHDLRRTMGSWQARMGASLIIVGKSLGHKSPQATAIYSRLDIDPVRKSMQTATGAMFDAAGMKNNVVVTTSYKMNVEVNYSYDDNASKKNKENIVFHSSFVHSEKEKKKINQLLPVEHLLKSELIFH